jgi:NADPH:quinone reductase-like Zn-dependent oxidoreductase
MVQMARLQAGEKVLIHAGASGVGLAAIQIAKALEANVIVTASLHKHALCRHYGADLCIDYKEEDFVAEIQEAFGGVDVVVEMVGAPYWEGNLQVLNFWGRLVFVGLMGGATHEINFGTLMQKRLSIMGSTLRNRTTLEKTALIEAFWAWAEPLFLKGTLRPTVWQTYPWEEVEAAHTAMHENRNAGKIVLTIGE